MGSIESDTLILAETLPLLSLDELVWSFGCHSKTTEQEQTSKEKINKLTKEILKGFLDTKH